MKEVFQVNIESIKKLREETGVGIMDVKHALIKADGNYDKALKALKEEGMLIAKKRTAKITKHSTIGYYIHANQRIAVLVELSCESDITSKSDFFIKFANDIAMHIAAMNCQYISRDDVPEDLIEQMRKNIICQTKNENKSNSTIEKIVKRKLEKFYQTNCLLEQKYYRDKKKSIQDIIMEFIYKHKENIEIKRFVYYEAGKKNE